MSTGPEETWIRQTILDFKNSLVNRVHIAIINISNYVYITRATSTFIVIFGTSRLSMASGPPSPLRYSQQWTLEGWASPFSLVHLLKAGLSYPTVNFITC